VHPSITPEEAKVFSRIVLAGSLVAASRGAWNVEDTWNKLLPEYRFQTIEEHLAGVNWDAEA